MALKETLNHLFTDKLISPKTVDEIPKSEYMVYILAFDDKPIVVGKGKRNRAKIIFDDMDNITFSHYKSFFVRLFHIYEKGAFTRYLINCEKDSVAKGIEKQLHEILGGNKREEYFPINLQEKLFQGLTLDSTTGLLLNLATASSYSGLSDLKKWNKNGYIPDESWIEIKKRLKLNW